MAYYSKISEHKTSGQKRRSAEQRGGFDDEGTQYSGARNKRSGAPVRKSDAQPADGAARPYARKPADGETRSYTRKPADGSAPAKRTYGKPPDGAARPYTRKSADGEIRSYARKPADGSAPAKRTYGKPADGDARSYTRKSADGSAPMKRSYNKAADGETRSYSRKPADGETRSYSRKPADGETRSYSRKPADGETRSYTRKPADGSAPVKRTYGKPADGDARPYARKSADGETRSYSRKPADGETRSYTRKPADGSAPVKRSYSRSAEGAQGKRGYGSPAGDGEQRFASRFDQPGRTRGDHITPRPYAEQKREQRFTENRPEEGTFRAQPPAEDTINENLLSGRNPIREALKSGRDIEKLLISRGELSGSAREIVAIAKEQHVPVQEVDRVRLDAITPHHQGMLAFASAYKYHSVGEMLALAKSKGEHPFLVMLDGVTDPHNLGAVIRTAECAGAHGVIVQERRAVGLTPAAVKASAGAIEHIMVARVVNLVTTLEMLKKQGVWAYAADMSGEDYLSVDYSGGAVIVIGAEGEGVSRLVLEKCDKVVSLPIRGQIGSLNASVAAGILLYAVLRSR